MKVLYSGLFASWLVVLLFITSTLARELEISRGKIDGHPTPVPETLSFSSAPETAPGKTSSEKRESRSRNRRTMLSHGRSGDISKGRQFGYQIPYSYPSAGYQPVQVPYMQYAAPAPLISAVQRPNSAPIGAYSYSAPYAPQQSGSSYSYQPLTPTYTKDPLLYEVLELGKPEYKLVRTSSKSKYGSKSGYKKVLSFNAVNKANEPIRTKVYEPEVYAQADPLADQYKKLNAVTFLKSVLPAKLHESASQETSTPVDTSDSATTAPEATTLEPGTAEPLASVSETTKSPPITTTTTTTTTAAPTTTTTTTTTTTASPTDASNARAASQEAQTPTEPSSTSRSAESETSTEGMDEPTSEEPSTEETDTSTDGPTEPDDDTTPSTSSTSSSTTSAPSIAAQATSEAESSSGSSSSSHSQSSSHESQSSALSSSSSHASSITSSTDGTKKCSCA